MLIQSQLAGVNDHPQDVSSKQPGANRNQDSLATDEDLIRSHLQKIQDLEKLREIIDGELERARNDAKLTVVSIVARTAVGESRPPASSPSNPSGSSEEDAGAVARFLDLLGRKK